MAVSIEKEIEPMMMERHFHDLNCCHVKEALETLNSHLFKYKHKGWSAFVYGSTTQGLATIDDTIDICVTNSYSYTTTQQPIITQDNVNFERLDISDNTDALSLSSLASDLLSAFRNKTCSYITYSQAPDHFCRFDIKNKFSSINRYYFDMSVGNTLDIERSNLIIEYLSLDKRIRPVLFALKRFIKLREIDNEENGFPNSHVFVMMTLYFLMFVQDPPIIPCLHAISADKASCNYPVCRSKSNEKVQGFDVTYHNCALIDRAAEYNPLLFPNIKVYGTPWVSKSTKSFGELLIEAFGWFSLTAAILEPKSINSKEPLVLQPEWKRNFMVFADVFDPKLNIAASCTVAGAKIINQEFANAYIDLGKGASLKEVMFATDTILTPITIKPHKYTRNGF